jgi:hypothetical protein
MNRVLTAARLQLVHPLISLGIPWLVAAMSFGINWAVWALADLREQTGGDGFTGGVGSLYITGMVVFVGTVTQLLPFAMGVSLSRRSYFLGTALYALALSVSYGVLLAVLDQIERATDGWGVGVEFWTPTVLQADNFFLQIAVSAAPMLALAFLGMGIGIVYKRWGQPGVWGLILGTIVVFGGLAVLITWLQAWGEVGRWFADQSLVTLAIALPVAIAAVTAALSFTGIRRVVP